MGSREISPQPVVATVCLIMSAGSPNAWSDREGSRLEFSRPAEPTHNTLIEAFDARLRAERRYSHVFGLLEDAAEASTSRRRDRNAFRPRSDLGMLIPGAVAEVGQRN